MTKCRITIGGRLSAGILVLLTGAATAGCGGSSTSSKSDPPTQTVVKSYGAEHNSSGDSGCGSVTVPMTGVVGTVVVAAGGLSCEDARLVVDRYLNDVSLSHVGNSWSAEFDGWGCSMPTAVAAEQYGYIGQCLRGDDEIRVVASSSDAAQPSQTPAAEAPDSCDAATISEDIGRSVQVVRCYGAWAYVTTGELGDSTSLVRRDGDTWTRYTGFPSSICRNEAGASGVPAEELSSFRDC